MGDANDGSARAKAQGLPGRQGPPGASPADAGRHSPGAWKERIVGLGLLLVAAVLFFGMTLPGLMASWYCCMASGLVALGGTFFGVPLLVTGRIRQPH